MFPECHDDYEATMPVTMRILIRVLWMKMMNGNIGREIQVAHQNLPGVLSIINKQTAIAEILVTPYTLNTPTESGVRVVSRTLANELIRKNVVLCSSMEENPRLSRLHG